MNAKLYADQVLSEKGVISSLPGPMACYGLLCGCSILLNALSGVGVSFWFCGKAEGKAVWLTESGGAADDE